MVKISKKQAQAIVINAQLLNDDISLESLEIIKNLGYVQIDSISVVQRAHHHIVWSRNNDYQQNELNDLLQQRSLFEYWSHAASYLPIEDYPYYLPKMHEYQKGKKHWFKADKKMIRYVLDRIKAEGPLMSKDFKTNQKTKGWYEWKPAKKALNQLFMDGSLMVSKRVGFQKVYDLAENVLPSHISTKIPAPNQFAQFLIQRQLSAMGASSTSQIFYLQSGKIKKLIEQNILTLTEQGLIVPIKIEDLDETYYILSKNLNQIKKISNKSIKILSPFDNLVIQRKRLSQLFDFEYQLECYVPPEKRKYGYFCLPILCGDQFLGLIDAKVQRKEKVLKVIKFHPHLKTKIAAETQHKLTQSLNNFALFNCCQDVSMWNSKTEIKVS